MFDKLIEWIKDVWDKIKRIIINIRNRLFGYLFGKRVTYLAFYHKNHLIRKKNQYQIIKRIRYFNKYCYNN